MRKRTYTGTNYQLVACRCGARYARCTKYRDGREVLRREYAQDGQVVPGCISCGRVSFVPVQQLHPGGKFLSGSDCPCAELCRSWGRVIG